MEKVISRIEPFYKLYKVWLKIALFASSFYIPYIFFMAYFELPAIYFYYPLAVFTVVIHLSNIKKPLYIKTTISALTRIVKISGSIFVLFVIFNAYLRISNLLYRFYLLFWNSFGIAANKLVISEMLALIIVFMFIYGFSWIIGLKVNKILKAIFLFFSLIVFIYIYSIFKKGDISDFLIQFFGFSLFFLHAGYLRDELSGLIKTHTSGV